jgi:glycosyltransferase involved in cell wall biosynthesis
VNGPAVVSPACSEPVSFEPVDEGSRRQRALLMAYWCHPESGMEARIGWYRAIRAAKLWDTWIMFSNDQDLDLLLDRIDAAGVSDSLNLVCIPPTQLERWLARCPQFFYWSYGLWQRRAYAVAKQLHGETPFDLVHQVSFCGYRQPGHVWKLGVPFVFGPVGGTQNFPWRFLPAVDLAGGIREAVRNVVNSWQLRFSLAVRRACRSAAAVLAANSTGQRDLSRAQRIPVIEQLETGVERCPTRLRQKRQRRPNDPLRILWTGRLETWKALPLLLKALAQLPKSCRYELRILGVGKCRQRWQRLAERLGIADHIAWLGWGTYSELLPHYPWADVFAFTSLRDTSGSGLLEALAAGVPIVGVNHQGAADIMTDDCAVPIPVNRPNETIAAFRDAISELANDAARLHRLSEGARTRATQFLWERQGDFIDRVYRQVLPGEKLTAPGTDSRPEPVIAVGSERLLIPAIAAPSAAPV